MTLWKEELSWNKQIVLCRLGVVPVMCLERQLIHYSELSQFIVREHEGVELFPAVQGNWQRLPEGGAEWIDGPWNLPRLGIVRRVS